MPIQLIDSAGNVSILSPAEVQIIIESLDDAITTQSLTLPPQQTADEFYTDVIALKTKLLLLPSL